MDDPAKIYPDAASEIGNLFGLHGSSANPGTFGQDSGHGNTTGPSPANLPVFDPGSDDVIDVTPSTPEAVTATTTTATNEPVDVIVPPPPSREHQPPTLADLEGETDQPKNRLMPALKKAAPYLVVFTVGLLLYYYFFASFSFSSLFKGGASSQLASHSEQANQIQALQNQQAAAYRQWIAQFFYDVSDPSVVDMNADISGNGLTNFDKFMFNLNPKAYDTLGLGMPDGQTILNGINPWTGQSLTDNQKQIVELYFDKQVISDRLAAGALKQSQQVAFNSGASNGFNSSGYGTPTNYSFVDGHNQTSGVANYGGSRNGNASAIPSNARIAGVSTFGSPTTTTAPVSLTNLDINTNVPGRLEIPANKINTPLIFSKSTNDLNSDLHKGVIHYPGTPLPGDIGTSFISGHSSGYLWDKNPYKTVFRGLGNVKDGTSFTITVTLNNGKKVVLHYVVQYRKEFAPNDPAQFTQTGESMVELSTCWPIDTTAKRLGVFAKLSQTEYQ